VESRPGQESVTSLQFTPAGALRLDGLANTDTLLRIALGLDVEIGIRDNKPEENDQLE
jgi:hypothetical protein